jgi:hypothetical protein
MGSAIYYLSSSHSETGMVIIDARVETSEELAANSGLPQKMQVKIDWEPPSPAKTILESPPTLAFYSLFRNLQSSICNLFISLPSAPHR